VISSVIIEDNKEAQEYLVSLLQSDFPEIMIEGMATSIEEGLKLINAITPELVFMDIQLEDGLSFDILEQLHQYDFEVIFTTGFDNYYEKAIAHFAFSYLLKPIDPEALGRVIQHYKNVKNRHLLKSKYTHFKEFIREHQSKVLLNTGNSYIAVMVDEIVSCQADGNYTVFTLKNGEQLLVSHILKHYETLFQYKGFFRPNRSTLINIKHIISIIKKETIVLTNNVNVHISSRKKAELDTLINSLT